MLKGPCTVCLSSQVLARREQGLLTFLRSITAEPAAWGCPELRSVLGVSAYSFLPALGAKGLEGWVTKKSKRSVCGCVGFVGVPWKKRWIALKGAFWNPLCSGLPRAPHRFFSFPRMP